MLRETHLCWLDADNLTENGFVDFVYSNFKLHPNCILNVPYSDDTEGFGGRIVCSKHHFLKVNGYDESFVGWGYEEIDFVNRLCKTGCKKISIPKSISVNLNTVKMKEFPIMIQGLWVK